MTQTAKTAPTILCPSINPIGPDARVFGVFTASAAEELRVGYLTEALPATPELLAAAAPAKPTKVFPSRGALRRARQQTFRWRELPTRHPRHSDARSVGECAAPMRDPRDLPVVPPGWAGEACLRCPLVTTEQRNPTELQRAVAG
jgi:hypothetical protein